MRRGGKGSKLSKSRSHSDPELDEPAIQAGDDGRLSLIQADLIGFRKRPQGVISACISFKQPVIGDTLGRFVGYQGENLYEGDRRVLG